MNDRDTSPPETPPETSQSGSGGSHVLKRLVLFIPVFTVLPFVFVGRALQSIWANDQSRNILIAGAWLLGAGTVVFMIVESLSPLDAFYFSFITLTTIGYGDIAPHTDIGKALTVIYAVVGLGIFAALIGTIATQRPHLRRRHDDPVDGGSEDVR